MPTIIDFNGYIVEGSDFIIKEYSLLILNKKGRLEFTHTGVLKPICHWKKLDNETFKNYTQEFCLKFGIPWNTGTESLKSLRENIDDVIAISKRIYVRDNEQKKLLMDFLGLKLDDKFTSLVEDLGYEAPLKMSTHCIHHADHRNNNCAIDNVEAMYDWLLKSKNSRKYKSESKEVKKHVVVDFIGYYIPEDRFVIKEFNAYVLNDPHHIVDNKLNKYFITGKPGYISSKSLQLEDMPIDYQAHYQAFYESFGIPWDAGSTKFGSYQRGLRKYFQDAINIYVKNNGNKKLLLELIGSENESKIIVLIKVIVM
ncbi:uncharacterized protein LOC123264463 [Cotesia glomerata]|uniref:uncharacterized protein LOC123264463 n=1 Tax=Cotesia glomerata TaxID=32391 RepID=UPI001D01966A|nr:uncharacterized protein LOC123264463 [Cotesia glomerata]